MAKLGGGSLVRAGGRQVPATAGGQEGRAALARLRRVSGNDYSIAFAAEQLTRLGMACETSADSVSVTVPSYRPDITIAEDLVEEILRMGEFSKPARKERVASNATELANPEGPADRARLLLAGAGLSEIVTWAFVPKAVLGRHLGRWQGRELGQGIALRNPISADYEVMRTSLASGLGRCAQTQSFARSSRGVAVRSRARRAPAATDDATPVEAPRRRAYRRHLERAGSSPASRSTSTISSTLVENLLRGFGL
jgi:phenylalanyl-tRNA synthetase beta subunit